MAQEFNAFSVATKGYACGIGTTGFFAFAIASKGYICDAEEEEVLRGGDSSGPWRKKQIDTSLETMLAREDEEVLSVIMVISKKRRR